MGLDIYCDKESIKVGSYSNVDKIKKEWIKAYIDYLNEINETELANLLYEVIKDDNINYLLFNRIVLDFGLKSFVSHSDYDGIWTSNEAESILDTLNIIKPYLIKYNNYNFGPGNIYYLEPVLKESRDTGIDITFC